MQALLYVDLPILAASLLTGCPLHVILYCTFSA